MKTKPTSRDAALEAYFGASIGQLYAEASAETTTPALVRALELRSFLALAEEQVARVRDRVHSSTSADRDMDELSSTDLRMDAQWMEAGLSARNEYASALAELLRTMPSAVADPSRAAQFAQPKLIARTAPTPASRRGAVRARQP
ncbi:hypothetical protein ACFC0C_16220 [Streptomyces sp. NPDC056178]|uniref:hypothetical protein n=1 Tax=unclassified Streptomyces TaxID=2593676 RepID=UPI0035D9F76A